jgi:hypothetical protein
MFGVDKADQLRAAGGGFALKAHYKKWYKKGFFAILDCMLLNAYIAWNLSTSTARLNRQPLKRHQFYTYFAERLLNYKEDAILMSPRTTRLQAGKRSGCDVHVPVPCVTRARCSVCRLELGMDKGLGQKGLTTNVVRCAACGLHAHNVFLLKSNRRIHQLPQFDGLTCFELAHSAAAKGMWSTSNNGDAKNSLSLNHAVVKELRVMYGLEETVKRKRRRSEGGKTTGDSSDTETEETEKETFDGVPIVEV